MNAHLERLEEQVQSIPTDHIMSPDLVWTAYMFTMYIVNLAEDGGWSYDGHSFKVGDPLGTLTVRSHVQDAPMVSFVNGRTMLECMGVFVRWCELGDVRWYPDKFRQI